MEGFREAVGIAGDSAAIAGAPPPIDAPAAGGLLPPLPLRQRLH